MNGCFVLGLDGTSAEAFDDVFNFVHDSGLYEVQVTVVTAFPGSPLHARWKAAGQVIEDEAWETRTLFDVNFVPERMTAEELRRGFRDLATRLYTAEETARRRALLKDRLRTLVRSRRAAPQAEVRAAS